MGRNAAEAPVTVDTVPTDVMAEWKAFRDAPRTEAIGDRFRPLKRIREFVVDQVVARARRKAEAAGQAFDEAKVRQLAEDTVAEAIGDGSFFDWLMNGGLEKIIQLIMTLIGLFG